MREHLEREHLERAPLRAAVSSVLTLRAPPLDRHDASSLIVVVNKRRTAPTFL